MLRIREWIKRKPELVEVSRIDLPARFVKLDRMSVKDQVIGAIQRLPDDIDFRDVVEEVAFLAALSDAEADIEQGRIISNEEMKMRIERWTAK